MPVASSFTAALPPTKHFMPVHGIEFQPSEVCPKNFIIFDQTDYRSQIMFHPAVAHKFNTPGLNMHTSFIQETFERKEVNDIEREISSSLKEDSDDIEALLSLEEDGEQEDYDDEEVSTARAYGNYGCNSPDSCSTYGSKPRKNGSSSVQKSSGSGSSSNSERKRQKMKKMVKTLRGIVPGGDQMNTVTVIDEAVRYLKSLKVEVQKLGVGGLKN
ncbi:hypothetical protein JCGZ_04583 [Jatropha curcas]|uniref:BHLH domain-containing protein n=2 Tax=Jatropha curcas TaxID=180498 RepID=A0A067L0B9_JATCU|nr:hypothetical protein JCGZ_04583 [Jatropha curcas]